MSEKRLKTLNLNEEACRILDEQPNASKYARMAIIRYRELLNEVAFLDQATSRNWQDLKVACAIIRQVLAHGAIQSTMLTDALGMDEELCQIWEQEEARGHGVDFIVGRVRVLGRLEKP